jgi:MFS family permease
MSHGNEGGQIRREADATGVASKPPGKVGGYPYGSGTTYGDTSLSNKILFWASFLTLIAAGMGFSIRGDIMALWGREYGFTQTELGVITGMGLFTFCIPVIFFSLFADNVGYGRLMILAFLFHAASVLVTLAAPFAFASGSGKAGAYMCLYIGQFCFGMGNGTCETVINPLTASLFPRNKTHWLNILHAGWPGGLVLGALVSLGLNQIDENISWLVRWGIISIPMLIYGLLMAGRRFPRSEAKEHGVSVRSMMGEIGMLGTAVVCGLLGLWFSNDLFPNWLYVPASLSWLGWVAAGVLWVLFGFLGGFRLGYVMLALLFVLHAMVGYVELGTDNWIIDIGKTVLSNRNMALIAFIWTNVLMFTLRFFAGPIVHKISPVGLLFVSACIGTVGLLLLGMPATNTIWLWIGALSVYAIGKTFYWPTMLGVISERFPKGGALALGFSGGMGMLSAGVLGGPLIGYKQDFAATRKLQQESQATYQRYKSGVPLSPLPGLPKIAGLDNSKVAVLRDDGKQLQTDLEALRKSDQTDKNLESLNSWWTEEAKEHAPQDKDQVQDAVLHGDRTALTWTAGVPAAMAVGYLLLLLYFMARGGYKQVHISDKGEEVEDKTAGETPPAP